MKNNHTNRFNPLRIIPWALLGITGVACLALLLGLIVMVLWNRLMPGIFELPEIGYWQAWGMVVLTHILFKGFSGPGMHWSRPPFFHREHFRDREEWKQKFHDRLRNSRRPWESGFGSTEPRENRTPDDHPSENKND